jgi:small subunit ribosomal protein S20
MPIAASAKKALRGSLRKKKVNDQRKKTMKDEMKKVERLVKEKKVDEARKLVSSVFQTIDKAAKKGVIKKNNAANKKSRMSRITKEAKA